MENVNIQFEHKPWNISQEIKKIYSNKRIRKILEVFNRISNSKGVFCMLDYTENKLIMAESSIYSITQYEPIFVDNESRFEFYAKILPRDELEWYFRMIEQALEIFYSVSEDHRKHITISYDLILIDSKLTLLHNITPFQLDKSGNLLLGLAHVSIIPTRLPITPKASMINHSTGDEYVFINDKFILTETKTLSDEDIRILKWWAEDLTTEQICDELRISESSYKRKRKKIFDKLNVQTPAGAVFKAGALRLL